MEMNRNAGASAVIDELARAVPGAHYENGALHIDGDGLNAAMRMIDRDGVIRRGTADSTPLGALVTGGDPAEEYPVPPGKLFYDLAAPSGVSGIAEYLPDPGLVEIVAALSEEHANFRHLNRLGFDVLWKRSGGSRKGAPALYGCKRLNAEERHFSQGKDFLFWLAADHLRDAKPTRLRVEELVAGALCMSGIDDHGNATIVPPDFSGYLFIVARYGVDSPELAPLGAQVAQLPLFAGWVRGQFRGVGARPIRKYELRPS